MTPAMARTRLLVSTVAVGLAAAVFAPAAAHAETVYTFAQVQSHGTAQDCWTIVNGGVYNLTGFIGRHEGGSKVIIGLCGIDGSAAYNGQHGGNQGGENEPARALARYRIGVLDPASVPKPTGSYTMAQVAAHNQAADCWSVVDGKVYNLTSWISRHPGGPAVITSMCGKDGTALFDSQHKGSASAAGALNGFVLGTVSGSSTAAPPATGTGVTKLYSMAQVRKHHTKSNCWAVLHKKVYNLTKWIPQHPGGAATITGLCGKRGAAAFNAQHGGAAGVASILAGFQIGRIA